MPVQQVYALLPPGHELTGLEVLPFRKAAIEGRYRLTWGQRQHPVSAFPDSTATPPDTAVYSSPRPFPADRHHLVGVWSWRGYQVAVIDLYPVEYLPAAGIISYYPALRLQLHTAPSPEVTEECLRLLRPSPMLDQRLRRLVRNPEIIAEYDLLAEAKAAGQDPPMLSGTGYPYLIITDQSLTEAFQVLADHKTRRGLRTQLLTVQEIAQTYPGVDLPAQIRSCILDYYGNQETDFVLLGGDAEVVPHRGLYAQAFGYTDDDIPADLYYGALDGTWNDDGDDLWGEPGESDLLPEVSVGRAPVDDLQEALQFVDKLIRYEQSPVAGQTVEALMAGEELFDNPQTWGGDYKDEIRYGSDQHGFVTQGFPPQFTVNTLYDRDLGYTWWGGILLNLMNDGVHLINHIGHASVNRALRLTSDQVLNELTNDGIEHSAFIIYSQGCYAASFDNRNPGGAYLDDCVAEAFVTGEHGAVAFIGNSRYGWAQSGATSGISQYFDRQFFDALFGENTTALGPVNDDSKVDNLWALDYNGVRWCYYELNLLGDPSMAVWTDHPRSLTVTHPETITIDELNTFLVFVFAEGIKVPGALVCISGNDSVYQTKLTLGGGIALMSAEPVTPDTLHICVTAENCLPYHGTILARAAGPSLWYECHGIDDDRSGDSWGNEDGILNQGEIVELTLWLRNFGDQGAEGVSAVLTAEDPYITLLDPERNYPDIDPDEEAASDDPFIVSVSSDCPDGHQFEMTVEARKDETPIGTSSFSLTVSAPELSFERTVLKDAPPLGDGDGFLESGESALLMATVRNDGSSSATLVKGELFIPDDPYIQVDRSSAYFSSLESGAYANGWPAYKITASPESPPNHFFDYRIELTAKNRYDTVEGYPGVLGPSGLIDDMEGEITTWKSGELWHRTDRESHSPVTAWYAGEDSAGGYPDQVDASLTSEEILLLSGSRLSFWHRYDLDEDEDFGAVEIQDDTVWSSLHDPFTGSSDGWVRECFDLSDRPSGSAVRIRFRLISDEGGSGEGWYLDDITLAPPPGFCLDSARVTPDRGIAETPFTFSIRYISEGNYTPTSARIFIDGTPYLMTTMEDDFTAGALYTYKTTLDLAAHQYYFEFSNGLESVRWPRLSELYGPLVVETFYHDDFENDDGGYLVTGGNWEWGLPVNGPSSAHSGQNVWATNLDGNYASGADARLETGSIDLTKVLQPELSLWQWFSFEPREANYDGGNVKVSCDGGPFQIIEPEGGYEGIIASNNSGIPGEPGFCSNQEGRLWHRRTYDLDQFSGHEIVIRFHMGSNGRYTYPGWYIDDVSVTGLGFIPHPVGVGDVSVSTKHEDIHLSWSRPGEGTPSGYAVYRDLFSNQCLFEPRLITIVTDTTYVDIGAAGNTVQNFYYQIRVLDDDGEQSNPSEAVGEFDVPLHNDHSR